MHDSALNEYNKTCKNETWFSTQELFSLQKLPVSIQNKYLPRKIFQKSLLSLYTGAPPSKIKINFKQKPQLEFSGKYTASSPNFAKFPLHYNLSHTENCSVMALASREIGVDIEKIRPIKSKLSFSSKVCSEEEIQFLNNNTETKFAGVSFWKLWTLKEAFLKWQGLTLQSNFSLLSRINFIKKSPGVFLLKNHDLNLQFKRGEGNVKKGNLEKAFFLQKQIDHSYMLSLCTSAEILAIPQIAGDLSNFSTPADFPEKTLNLDTITLEQVEVFEFSHGCYKDEIPGTPTN